MNKTNNTKKFISFVSAVLLAANSVAVVSAEPERNVFDETENEVFNEAAETESFLSASDVAKADEKPEETKVDGYYILQYSDHVVIKSGEKEFEITEAVIPAEINGLPVTEIGASAFDSFKSLKKVVIPDTVTKIGYAAFRETAITEISLHEGITAIGNDAFSKTGLTKVVLPASLETISGYSTPFESCPELKEVVFAEGIKAIPANILDGAKSVTTVTIPETVTKIGFEAFTNTSLNGELVLHEGITEIGEGAFGGTGLTKVVLPLSFEKVDGYSTPFASCKELTEVVFAEGMKRIPANILDGASSVTAFNIPDTVTEIGAEAFNGTGITKVVLPASLEKVDDYSTPFASCKNLTEVVFTSGTTVIPANILDGAKNVTTVTIPKTVTKLNTDAFSGCSSLNTIYGIPNFDSITIGTDALKGVDVDNIKFIADAPSVTPSAVPSEKPSVEPSTVPSEKPSVEPSTVPATPPSVQKGDVDGDGSLSTTDVKNILKFIVEKIKFTDDQKANADMNGDGAVNSADAFLLLRAVVSNTETK